MTHAVKGFGIVNKAEIDVFLELSCFFDDPPDVGNLISGSKAFSKTSLNIWKFMVHVLLKPGLENFKHYFTSVWDECNCAVVWAFFGIAFLWDWNENQPFPVRLPLLSFPNLLALSTGVNELEVSENMTNELSKRDYLLTTGILEIEIYKVNSYWWQGSESYHWSWGTSCWRWRGKRPKRLSVGFTWVMLNSHSCCCC